jgi:enoyl-CoA hydratase/carnithine racemase
MVMAEMEAGTTNLARGPSITIELTKQAVYHAMGISLEAQAQYEENLLNKGHHTEGVQEGRLPSPRSD